MSLAACGKKEYYRAYAKWVSNEATEAGFNGTWGPIVDIVHKPKTLSGIPNGSHRRLSNNPYTIIDATSEIAAVYKQNRYLSTAKHYPGGSNPNNIDSHMTESISYDTKEELINEHLYPYKKLLDEDLLGGIMTGHKRIVNIDNTRPASLSKPVIDIIREMGFEGIAITDALCMMGIRAKYNDVEAKGYAIAAGNDLLLPFTQDNRVKFEKLVEAYDQGLIPDEALDAAVKRVLATQHKTTLLTDDAEVSDEELKLFYNINKDNICAITDEGIPANISRDGKHFFAMLVRNEMSVGKDGKIDVDTFSSNWLYPEKVKAKILELFPNSQVEYIYEFPTQAQNTKILSKSLGCDELVFLTFTEPLSFCGEERLTHRFVT
jgi:beta-glucosidase-like glycosyl hydrolase